MSKFPSLTNAAMDAIAQRAMDMLQGKTNVYYAGTQTGRWSMSNIDRKHPLQGIIMRFEHKGPMKALGGVHTYTCKNRELVNLMRDAVVKKSFIPHTKVYHTLVKNIFPNLADEVNHPIIFWLRKDTITDIKEAISIMLMAHDIAPVVVRSHARK